MKLGYIDTLLPIAAKAVTGAIGVKSGGGGGTSQPIARTAAQPGALPTSQPITVSPAMQQAFTPQFSPVLQQTQDSPGAVQSAAPQQYASPGQTARSGATVPGGAVTPGVPGVPRFETPDRGPAFPEAFPDPYAQPVIQDSGGMPDLLKTGILAVAAVATIKLINDNRKRKR